MSADPRTCPTPSVVPPAVPAAPAAAEPPLASALLSEGCISLAEACRLLPGRGGRRLVFSTLWRWVLKGARAPGGRLVRLEAVRLGNRWVTSRQAVARFSAALTPELGGEQASRPRPAGAERRQKAIDQAERDLRDLGV